MGIHALLIEYLEVIGAGFGRTGTTSLQAALEILGYVKCYHMSDVYRAGEGEKWLRKASGENVSWDELLNGVSAAIDWPVASYYKELVELNPQAKVLLTVRDEDSWYRSLQATLYSYYKLIPRWRQWLSPKLRNRITLQEVLVWNGVFNGRVEDAEYAKKIYRDHNEEVKRTVPADRLLVVDLTKGWEPICEFLGKPIPKDTPFPHINTADRTQHKFRKLRLQKYAPYVLLLALVVFVIFFI
ncbi:MAG: sulfotransferase family protein [Gammaproteobacteria bacterium]|nr:sulfotransferase family protein [Gammaproteobacteria bacterium]